MLAFALAHAESFPGLTFEDLAKAIGRDEIWVAAVFYGQVWCHACVSDNAKSDHIWFSSQAKMDPEDLEALARALDIPTVAIQSQLGSHWWPNRGLGPMPPTDPVLYRLYEVGCLQVCERGLLNLLGTSRVYWFMATPSRYAVIVLFLSVPI
jgi:cyanate lyase